MDNEWATLSGVNILPALPAAASSATQASPSSAPGAGTSHLPSPHTRRVCSSKPPTPKIGTVSLPVISQSQAEYPANGRSRKQNVACDACRNKKIRCHRLSLDEKCKRCISKDLECTSEYIEQLQIKVKQPRKKSAFHHEEPSKKRKTNDLSKMNDLTDDLSGGDHADQTEIFDGSGSLHLLANLVPSQTASTSYLNQSSPIKLPSERQADLIRFMFSPTPVLHSEYRFNDVSHIESAKLGQTDSWEEMGGEIWDEPPTEAHRALQSAGMNEMNALVVHLMDMFFTCVNFRCHLTNPDTIKDQFAAPDTHPAGSIHLPFLAVVIAFGAKFSDHHSIVADKQECWERDILKSHDGRARSRMLQLLVIRAREVFEVCKVYRIVSVPNAQTLIMAEIMFAEAVYRKDGYCAYHSATAAQHLKTMKLTAPPSVFGIEVSNQRIESIFLWWSVALWEGFNSAFRRLQPSITDADYADASTGGPVVSYCDVTISLDDAAVFKAPSPTLPSKAIWFSTANAGNYVCRQLCRDFWTQRTAQNGITTSALRDFVHLQSKWRSNFFSKTNLPAELPADWNLLTIIESCVADAYYHSLWLVVERAIENYGLYEVKSFERGQHRNVLSIEAQQLRERIKQEALHASLRIAALVAILAANQWLKVDPYMMCFSVYEAGHFLARQGKDEYRICVIGLKQCASPYPQLWSLSIELENIYIESLKTKNAPPQSSEYNTASFFGFDLTSATNNHGDLNHDTVGGLGKDTMTTTTTSTDFTANETIVSVPVNSPFVRRSPPDFTLRSSELAKNGYRYLPDLTATEDSSQDLSQTIFEWLHQRSL